jgi:hypothetical protein
MNRAPNHVAPYIEESMKQEAREENMPSLGKTGARVRIQEATA